MQTTPTQTRHATLVGLLAGVAFLSLSAIGCQEVTPRKAQGAEVVKSDQAIAVRLAAAQEGRISSLLTYSGDVKPRTQLNVSAKGMGRVEELTVEVGSVVQAGQIVGRLESSALEALLRQAQAAVAVAKAKLAQMEAGTRPETVAQARANLDSLSEKLAAMEDGGRGEVVAQAEATLRIAEARLAQVKAGPTSQQLDQAEAGVRAARNQLYASQSQADAYLGSRAVAAGGLVFTQEMKEAQSGIAYEQVMIAEARLAELKSGATQEQIEQAQATVDQTRAALEMARNPFTERDKKQVENAILAAEQQLRLARIPFTGNDFEMVRASIAQAEANVDLVAAQLEDTKIVAPLKGIVAEKNLTVGALASPQIPILTIISDEIEISLPIEEARAGQIGVGLPVRITVAAYPDKAFTGEVASVAPTIDPRSRTFAAKVSLLDASGLKPGMFAKVNFDLAEEKNAVTVPEQAVLKRGSVSSVFTVENGRVRVRKVELGASDGKNAEVRSGLSAGEKVIVGNPSLKEGDTVYAEGM